MMVLLHMRLAMIDIYNKLRNIKDKNKKINAEINSSIDLLDNCEYEKASKSVEKVLYKIEKILIELREIYYAINYNFPEVVSAYYDNSAEILQMSITNINLPYTAYKVTIPFLLPNKRSGWALFKKSVGVSFLHMLEQYCKENNVVPIRNCSVIVVT